MNPPPPPTAEAITRSSNSNFALAFLALPADRRRDITTYYAFCRVIDDIADDPGPINKVVESPEFRKYFDGISGEMLKTAPRGYASDHLQIELLRHKQFLVVHPLNDERVLEPDFADYALRVFAAMKPFFDYLQPLVGQQMRPAGKAPKRKREQGIKRERI